MSGQHLRNPNNLDANRHQGITLER